MRATPDTPTQPSRIGSIPARGLVWGVRGLRSVYATFDAVLFEHVLAELPRPDDIDGVVFRRADSLDEPRLEGLWGALRQPTKLAEFRERLAEGCLCVVGVKDNEIVAITWLGREDSYGHLHTLPGSVTEIDVYCRQTARGLGIGRALLAHSAIVARDAGYARKVIYVQRENTAMLATIEPLGYTQIGTAHRRTALGRTTWSWVIRGQAGHGSCLTL